MTFDEVRAFLSTLPGVEEGTSYGTPGFRVGKRFLTRLKEDGDSLVVRLDVDEREMLMDADPDAFYLTDHYRPYPAVLVRLSRVEAGTLERLLTQHWRQAAPKRLVKAAEQGSCR
jgi:hypothetical protein